MGFFFWGSEDKNCRLQDPAVIPPSVQYLPRSSDSTTISLINMISRTERFQRKPRETQSTKDEVAKEPEEVVKFLPEEEAVSSGNSYLHTLQLS
jgi:hypothetical protein